MHPDIAEQPLARAVLRHLAANRDAEDPLGSFARTVIAGEATLRAAADFRWHSEALAEVAADAERMTAEERAGYEVAAGRLGAIDEPAAGSPRAGNEERE
ncbi:hypothetical protein HH310_17110 [Actinoplanes sp. TBRC 11911]|uniref:hypothetical protein n=1 Tax=Actinoplanes sp. TBRC 11911 TaxID=2729386 RepID=UPI00145FC413|nr:hypothetical protein [Actinoplanes sp. TBRC 11911]NMO52904.1 hypothetical protein [Actinoplanes sp. TBRC 11911]